MLVPSGRRWTVGGLGAWDEPRHTDRPGSLHRPGTSRRFATIVEILAADKMHRFASQTACTHSSSSTSQLLPYCI
jgi:hypothetical protein